MWPLVAFYHFPPKRNPAAKELRRLVAMKEENEIDSTSDASGSSSECESESSQSSTECEKLNFQLLGRVCALTSSLLASYPSTFVLRDFTEKKRRAENWISAPYAFYTGPQGYKLCLSVNSRGHRSRYVSVYVHLMWGEFDYQLKWPFKGRVQVKLMANSKRHQPCTMTITFDKDVDLDCRHAASYEWRDERRVGRT